MITIHKYILEPNSKINMPVGAEILCIQMQGDDACIWAKVDTDAYMETRSFLVIPTGSIIDPNILGSYIGTFQTNGLVFHVFNCKE